MSSETGMIALEQSGVLTSSKYATDEAFGQIAKGSSFLPRLQLMGGSSDAVKEGKIGIGRYALVRSKDQLEDLTPETRVLVLGWRPKAMDLSGEEIVAVYNPADPEFKRIEKGFAAKAEGCMVGPEYLVFVPDAEPACFATFYLASVTAQREAGNLRARIGKAATLKAQLIVNKKGQKWHGPVILPCSDTFAIPGMDEIKAQVEMFNSPPENQSEAAPAETRDR